MCHANDFFLRGRRELFGVFLPRPRVSSVLLKCKKYPFPQVEDFCRTFRRLLTIDKE